jgi:hypothetical protein
MVKKTSGTVFAQGMRRNGTTIVFDLMLEDGNFDCFYEPLAATRPSFGGGSTLRDKVDLFDSVRTERKNYISANPELLEKCPQFVSHNFLNYGAPRLASLEFEPELPDYCKNYLSHLTKVGLSPFIKFTRMHSKVNCLKEIDPDVKFIHIIRDPRHVTASYQFGKQAKFQDNYEKRGDFFTRVSNKTSWSSRDFSDFLIEYQNVDMTKPFEDYLRILLIWKYKFLTTYSQGNKAFGTNYFLLRHEDLLGAPQQTISQLYTFLEREPSKKVLEWAKTNLRSPSVPYRQHDVQWQAGFDRLDMGQALQLSGYAQRQ